MLTLAIDVGNSRIKFGLFETAACRPGVGALPACLRLLAVPVAEEVPWLEILAWPEVTDSGTMRGVVAGANPQGIARVCDTWPAAWRPPLLISDPTTLPLRSRLVYPRRVGIDRVLNAVAANVIREENRPTIIVDIGTATTIDLVSGEGEFEGGSILPGFELCARALHYYTALLPLISIDELASQPHEPLGRETRAALRSGLFWGQLGAIKELIARLQSAPAGQMPSPPAPPGGILVERHPESGQASAKATVLLTGGGAPMLAPHLPEARCERFLSLQGLALAGMAAGLGDL